VQKVCTKTHVVRKDMNLFDAYIICCDEFAMQMYTSKHDSNNETQIQDPFVGLCRSNT
jgi:hypothetical protein